MRRFILPVFLIWLISSTHGLSGYTTVGASDLSCNINGALNPAACATTLHLPTIRTVSPINILPRGKRYLGHLALGTRDRPLSIYRLVWNRKYSCGRDIPPCQTAQREFSHGWINWNPATPSTLSRRGMIAPFTLCSASTSRMNATSPPFMMPTDVSRLLPATHHRGTRHWGAMRIV